MTTTDLTPAELVAMTAQEYALLANAERIRSALAEGWTFYTLHPTDDAFWADQAAHGVVTAADLIRRDAIATHSDSYKEIHGIRPRWVQYALMTTEAIEAATKALYDDREVEAEEAALTAAADETPFIHNPFAVLGE